MEAACSTPPRAGMEIYTNTPKLRKYRKMILELLLSNHCSSCTTCEKNGDCRLQELAKRFGIDRLRFEKPGNYSIDLTVDGELASRVPFRVVQVQEEASQEA